MENQCLELKRDAFFDAIEKGMDRDGDAGFVDPVGWRGFASLTWDLRMWPWLRVNAPKVYRFVKELAALYALWRE